MGAPRSPKHKFSDSYSSLSSYASSSLQSGCHSRISSMSTVSGHQPFTAMLNDMPTFETKLAEHQQLSADGIPLSPRTAIPAPMLASPTGEDGPRDPARPHSPSDAILITRGAGGSNRSSPTDAMSPQHLPPANIGLLNLQDQPLQRSHKRTASAPDFSAFSGPSHFQPFPAVSENAPFPQTYPMGDQTNTGAAPAPAVQPEIKCMYIASCNTGSQPRKAISHIFGRNKLCTRMIPNHVWVHYCRKHYQRSRYRNGHEYAKLQIDLVIQQIERVQAWSDENKAAGNSGVVTSWSLQPRKREQKRLEVKQENKKRTFQQDDSDDDVDNAVMNGTAVPDWLQERFAAGYDTPTIMTVVQQLKTEIHGNQLSQIPDIEILPSISSDGTEDKPKAHLKRKTSGGNSSHKRSQSMGTALRQDFQPMPRMPGQAGGYPFPDSQGDFAGKRARTGDGYFGDRVEMSRPFDRQPNHMRTMQLTTRIREAIPEEQQFQQQADYSYGPGPVQHGGQPGPLPAPIPQRRPSQSTASHLEVSSNTGNPYQQQDLRRPSHQRSQSDASSFYQNSPQNYRPSSSDYPAPPGVYAAPGQYDQAAYVQGYPRADDPYMAQGQLAGQGVPVTQAPYYADASPRQYAGYAPAPGSYYGVAPPTQFSMPPAAARHNRHQSSPNVARPGEYATAPNMQGRFDMGGYDRAAMDQQRAYDNQPRHPQAVMDDETARALYAGRR
ncbi:ORP1 protein [Plectosphaerella cucumerina]|uniref:ORP1 protein n=1 Tax=Plectosphaerella cucumerina TaxID=40658 RepID=A0A8K0TDD5_9PEZI|nr:ORP1 protein [Plectosphaerella cucumerina]